MALDFDGVSERISLNVDIQSLWQEVFPFLKNNKPSVRSPAVAGWALQAPSGVLNPLHAGWETTFCPYNGPRNQSPSWTPRSETEKASHAVQDFHVPTPACTSGFLQLLQRLEELQLNPRRARIIRLAPGSAMQWHRDGAPEIYQARLHIPLLTNEGCFFENEQGRSHMPADGAGYFVHINQPHRAVNDGGEARFHFVVHVWDQAGITSHHRYQPQLCHHETLHQENCNPEQLFLVSPPSGPRSGCS